MSSTVSSSALVCPHLPLHATREQLQMGHQAQRLSAAEASPTAPTNDSSVLHNKALHHSHWSCLFGQIVAVSPPKNLGLLPIIRAGRPHSSAESSELENQALHPVSPIFHSPLRQSTPRYCLYRIASWFVAHAVLWRDLGLFYKAA